MAKKRANGEGNIRKRAGGRWEGRYTAGYNPTTGTRIIKNVLGKTQAECKAKLAAAMEATKGVEVSRADEYTVATWLRSWYDIYARPLRCRIHTPHLHPCHPPEARRGRTNHGQLHGTGDVKAENDKNIGEETELPLRSSFALSAHFRVWVKAFSTHQETAAEHFSQGKEQLNDLRQVCGFEVQV